MLVHLGAAFVARRGIGRHIREAVNRAHERKMLCVRQRAGTLTTWNLRTSSAWRRVDWPNVVCRIRSRDSPFEIDVAENDVRRIEKTLGFRQQFAVFVDQRLAVPCKVGGGFAAPRRRIQIRGQASRGLLPNQLMTIARLADHDVRRRQVHEHGRARQRGERRRRHGNPYVLAYFNVKAKERRAGNVE